jgi:predicted RNA-binding Zn-ribbon protein involved in translation (DUF1610 family)
MSVYLEKCSVCGALIDQDDLFCANCGTEAPQHVDQGPQTQAQVSTHNFDCQGCGASMSYDARAQTLRCPFCGSEKLSKQDDTKSLAADGIVPFAVDHDGAVQIMRRWLGNGFWRPSDLASSSTVTRISAVFVPYWVFRASTRTYWTADSSQVPFGARGDWVPLCGEHQGAYSGLLIGASGVLTPDETAGICPFDLSRAVAREDVDTENVIVEQFRVQRKYARPQARMGLENLERQACQQYVPGRCRNMKVNVRLEGMSSQAMLLPVWIMAYTYQNQVFRFLINGQTGQATGQAPVSWTKVFVAIAIVLLVALLIFLGVAGATLLSQGGTGNGWPSPQVVCVSRADHPQTPRSPTGDAANIYRGRRSAAGDLNPAAATALTEKSWLARPY